MNPCFSALWTLTAHREGIVDDHIQCQDSTLQLQNRRDRKQKTNCIKNGTQFNGMVVLVTERIVLLDAHMKNCEPFVSFPRLAIDNRKALSCLRMKFSSVGSREKGINVSLCVLWSILRHIQGCTGKKKHRNLIHQTWSLPPQSILP